MSVTPNDILNKNKDLDKRVKVEDINLNDVTIDDLKFNGDNYKKHINLVSLLENISVCQLSDAYNGISHRSGTIKSINQSIIGRFGDVSILQRLPVTIGELQLLQ